MKMPCPDCSSVSSLCNKIFPEKDIPEAPDEGNLPDKQAEFFLDLAMKPVINLHTVYNYQYTVYSIIVNSYATLS
jgi:hypothetical protein